MKILEAHKIKLAAGYFNRFSGVLVWSYIIALIAYGYMVTTIIFTNHTIPNAWVYSYPSHKTLSEGRWLADLIILLGGGSGVQLVQSAIGIGIVVVNGMLFCILNKVHERIYVFLTIVFISLYPAFFDYYSFTIDHITFALGDTLALAGVLAMSRIQIRMKNLIISVVLFTLSIASYQPKISQIAVLLIIWCLVQFLEISSKGQSTGQNHLNLIKSLSLIGVAAYTFILSVVVYYFIFKLTAASLDNGPRGNINDLGVMMMEILRAYPETWRNFMSRVEYLPPPLAFLPGISIIFGIVLYIWALRKTLILAFIAGVLVLIMPIALQLTYVINSQAWTGAGRILSSHAFLFSFFLLQFQKKQNFRYFGVALLILFSYFFFIVTSQGANHAAMKSIYDIEKINRVVYRIEQAVPDLYQYPRSLIVFGSLKSHNLDGLQWLKPDPYKAHTATDTFAPYRQVNILNFFLGKDILKAPTKNEIDKALMSIKDRRPWPAIESVFLDGDAIVVLLEYPYNGQDVTWTRD